ncbi:peptidylprolyl isomerase [Paenibacillus tengchongensis]|uniref:peptidylprolyl isomerase n=1 Tax=Paenibacillus tengchongensis TaxID=2608684 RepID=UPI00124E9F59|nr:peptidylprolyl isomerase [Paenibacillus tengchongensis]
MPSNKQKPWKVLLVTLAAAVSFSMLAACGNGNNNNNAEDNTAAVATYKEGTITEKEFDQDTRVMKFLSPQQAAYLEIDAFKESILKQEVAFEYLANQATDEAKKQAEEEADKQVAALKDGLGDTYEDSLKQANVTEAEIKAYMLRVLTVYQDMLLKLTDDEVKTEFEATKGDYTVATLRHVLIALTDSEGKERTEEDALKRANEAKAKLDGGADFAEVVKEYSDDTSSVEAGGQYKDKELGTFVEGFKEAAQTQPLNTVGDPVQSVYGYHIIEVEARKEATYDTLTEEQLQSVKSTAASNNLELFLENDLDSLEITINLPKSSAAADESGATAAPSASAEPSAEASPAATEAAE